MSALVNRLADALFSFGLHNKLGALFYPALILTSIVLLILAANSFRLFKLCFPILGAIMGYAAGSKAFASLVAQSLPDVVKLIDPAIVAGLACAIVCAIIFMAFRSVSILVLGVVIGYMIIGDALKEALKNLQIVRDIIINLDGQSAMMLAAILGGVCALVTVLIVKKFFNITYVISTSLIFTVLAFALPAVFLTAGMENAGKTVLMITDAASVLGGIFALKQYFRHRYFW